MAKVQTPKPVRGTQDIFGEEQERFQHVVETFERVRRLYGFKGVEMPVFEPTAVFARSLGETTDVVSKEMYSFEDRSGDSLTLRPEFTAGICRAFLTNGWQQHVPLKLSTHGPLFRYERPQKGRYRQFHQLDAEIIGAAEPAADVELLCFADQLLNELGISEGVTLQLNTLGDAESRDAWRAALVEHFSDHQADLSEDSKTRLEKNPLRILDSKAPNDKAIVADAPTIDTYLTSEASEFFAEVTEGLDACNVKWKRNTGLVRGFDYYRHTAFEFIPDAGSAAAEKMGSQSTLLGGGRFDGLIEALGGQPTPAVGWAAGIERLGMLLGELSTPTPELVVFTETEELENLVVEIVALLRRGGSPNRAIRTESQDEEPEGSIVSDAFSTGSTNKRYKKAKASGAWRGLSVEPGEGAIGIARLRDLNAADAKPVRNRIGEALATKFDFTTDRIENAHSWILKNRK